MDVKVPVVVDTAANLSDEFLNEYFKDTNISKIELSEHRFCGNGIFLTTNRINFESNEIRFGDSEFIYIYVLSKTNEIKHYGLLHPDHFFSLVKVGHSENSKDDYYKYEIQKVINFYNHGYKKLSINIL